jgi:putative lipoprotein
VHSKASSGGLVLAVTLAFCSVVSPARAADPDPDPWFGRDKALHFGVSAGIAGGTYAIGASVLEARGHALLVASGVTLAAGAGKELLDLAGYGTPSWRDFAADVAGMIVGLAVAWSLDLVVRGVDEQQRPLFRAPHQPVPSASSRLTVTPGLVLSF